MELCFQERLKIKPAKDFFLKKSQRGVGQCMLYSKQSLISKESVPASSQQHLTVHLSSFSLSGATAESQTTQIILREKAIYQWDSMVNCVWECVCVCVSLSPNFKSVFFKNIAQMHIQSLAPLWINTSFSKIDHLTCSKKTSVWKAPFFLF